MKQTSSFFVCLLLLQLTVKSQTQSNWSAFFQSLNADSLRGKKFKLEAAVKADCMDANASASLWVRVDKQDHKMGFFYNMGDKPIRINEWKVYTISGKIDKDAKWFNFGGLYRSRGMYYFDDFRLFIEDKKAGWLPVNFVAPGFETDSVSVKKNWHYSRSISGFESSISEAEAYEGRQCFKVDGSRAGGHAGYGDNSEAGKFAKVNGINIYYEEYGKGEPLLLLHGNSCSINLFMKNIPELSKYFRVIAVDTRGQGKSSEDGKPYTYELFAEDMNALLDQLHLDSVNIIGWSDGGNTGLIMAMRYPSKVKKLVTMGAVVSLGDSVVGKPVIKEVNKQLKELKKDTTAWAVNRTRLLRLLITEPDYVFSALHAIQCPVMVMAGENDIVKEEHTKGIAANIPHSKLYIVPGGSHEFPGEMPDIFNAAAIKFLQTGN